MSYKLSISDYKALSRYSLRIFISFILITPLTIILLKQLGYNQLVYGKVYIAILVLFCISFLFGLRNYYSKELIEFKDGKLVSMRYGNITIDDIVTYRIKNFKGTFSLIIRLKDGRKYSIGPQNYLTNKAIEEQFNFLDEFMHQIERIKR